MLSNTSSEPKALAYLNPLNISIASFSIIIATGHSLKFQIALWSSALFVGSLKNKINGLLSKQKKASGFKRNSINLLILLGNTTSVFQTPSFIR